MKQGDIVMWVPRKPRQKCMEEIARLNPLLTDNIQTQMIRLIQSLSMMVYLFDQGDGLSYQRVLKILEGEN